MIPAHLQTENVHYCKQRQPDVKCRLLVDKAFSQEKTIVSQNLIYYDVVLASYH
jgi:hypothetical protein